MSDPGLMRRAANFGAAVVRHVVSGFRRLTTEEYEERMAICRGGGESPPCPEFQKVGQVCRHNDCGCWLDHKAKWASANCPLGKWPDVPDP